MNSDPYDSAAWKTFGMLDADENVMFDDAMRDDPALRKYSLELDRLSAAIAASTAVPIEPGTGQLEGIQQRLKLRPTKRAAAWLAVSGWAAAVILALILIRQNGGNDQKTPASVSSPLQTQAPKAAAGKPNSKVVAKRLTQEIEVLRDNLEKYQHRDRILFTPVPGMALPVVMTMTSPGVPAEESPITTLLADAVRVRAIDAGDDAAELSETALPPPSAMPIYDPARDFGTLVVSNLADAGDGQVYNLWVVTETSGQPIYVGSLPASSAAGADSFDFSLGSTMIIPSGFLLTQDPQDAPASPTENNTVLQGPPPAG